MLYKDYTTKLLDMEHMNIRKIEVTESEILLPVAMKRRYRASHAWFRRT